MARYLCAQNEPARDRLRSGFLSALPEGPRERLLAEAIRINVPAGSVIYRDDERPRVIVVVSGLLRVFLSSVGGRQVTVRYARSGDVAGLAQVIGGPGPMSVQAMTAASVLALGVDTLRRLISTDPGVARACAEELVRQLYRALNDLSEQAFLSVRQRVVRQLLDLATPGAGPNLVVHASHEELADAVASVRVVVTRILHELRDERLVEVSRDGIVLLDPVSLNREAADRPDVAADRPVVAADRPDMAHAAEPRVGKPPGQVRHSRRCARH
ncbi:MAG TPA: Crp/Fnr family transcriptional regulator [Candidatus Limnocylindrales bacterium]